MIWINGSSSDWNVLFSFFTRDAWTHLQANYSFLSCFFCSFIKYEQKLQNCSFKMNFLSNKNSNNFSGPKQGIFCKKTAGFIKFILPLFSVIQVPFTTPGVVKGTWSGLFYLPITRNMLCEQRCVYEEKSFNRMNWLGSQHKGFLF